LNSIELLKSLKISMKKEEIYSINGIKLKKMLKKRNRALEDETEKFKIIFQQTITVKTNLESEKEKLEGMKRDNSNI